MTPDDPKPRLMPADPSVTLPEKHRDVMGFGDQIGSVERPGANDA